MDTKNGQSLLAKIHVEGQLTKKDVVTKFKKMYT